MNRSNLVKELVGPNLSSVTVPFTFAVEGGEEIRRAPMAYVPNLVAKVTQQNDRPVDINIPVVTQLLFFLGAGSLNFT